MKKPIRIRFQNGLSFEHSLKEILFPVISEYEFIDSENPQYIIFGPYGNQVPPKSDYYVRIGYFCENITPDLSICEWAFGIPREEEVKHPKYKKIQWHNLDPNILVKPQLIDMDLIQLEKNKFCNFVYSNPVPYRETFFKALNRYKKVDAPGKSMNNMLSFDDKYKGDIWQRKKQFLSSYKFTIAFENYSYPAYQTEKLYDAMQVYSIPIYCGDPYISYLFNEKSFVNAFDIMKPNYNLWVKAIEKAAQMNFTDLRPQFHNNLFEKTIRKIKYLGRQYKMQHEFKNINYKRLVDKIVEIDENPNLYRKMIGEPWLINNEVSQKSCSIDRWREIFQ